MNGVIVAKEISDSLRYAVSVVPNVSLFEYEVSFSLRPAHEIAKNQPVATKPGQPPIDHL